MVNLIELVIVGGIAYYLITTGTLDQIVQNLGITGGGGGGGAAAAAPSPAAGGSSRGYKGTAPTHSSSSTGYNTGSGGGGYGGGSPGWYTSGPQGSGHHHCVAHTSGCYCTDPPKCSSQGVPPTGAGECKPQFGTTGYLGVSSGYPKTADFSKCPAGTT